MSEPRTEAGKRLFARYPIVLDSFGDAEPNDDLLDAILAIEAEAATPAPSGLRLPSFAAVASLENGIREAQIVGGDVTLDPDAANAIAAFIDNARQAALASESATTDGIDPARLRRALNDVLPTFRYDPTGDRPGDYAAHIAAAYAATSSSKPGNA